MTCFDPRIWEAAVKKGIFIVSFNLYLDESSNLADIVLPDTSYLERLDLSADRDDGIAPVDDWAYHIRQPVVKPMYQRRQAQQVLLELGDRLGILGAMYKSMNTMFRFKDPYTLNPNQKYTWEQIVDTRLRGYFGEEHGLGWFKENGLIKWPKKVEEVYWRPFVKGRIPIYFEFFKSIGTQIEQQKSKFGMAEFDTSDFQPLPDWKPCPSYDEKRDGFDLYGIYYRVPLQSFTSTYNNPWLDEVSKMNPSVYGIAINTKTASQKGIKNGDWITILSAGTGQTVEGVAVLTDGIHPEVIAYASGGGHWAKHLPIASQKGKGICPEWLIPLNWEHLDSVSFNLDLCVKVKVTKKS